MLTEEQIRTSKGAANIADNQEDEEEGGDDQHENGEFVNDDLINDEDVDPYSHNPAHDVDAGADHPNPADGQATAPDNGAANQPTANGRLEQDGRGQPPRDPVVASETDPKRPNKKTAPEDDPTGAVAVVDRYLRRTSFQRQPPIDHSTVIKKPKNTVPASQHAAPKSSIHSTDSG